MIRLIAIVLLVLAMVLLAWHDVFGLEIRLPDREDLHLWIEASGLLGPALVVALMTIASLD